MITGILILVLAYFIGAIPFGYLVMLLFAKQDIRAMGSGNIGATNVLRSGKKWQGLLTLFLDAGKGALVVLAVGWILSGSDEWISIWKVLAAFMVIFGHIYTVFLHLKGGKGWTGWRHAVETRGTCLHRCSIR